MSEIKIVKRNGEVVDYNGDKIFNAIIPAMLETGIDSLDINEDLINEIEGEVKAEIMMLEELHGRYVTVEQASDIVEDRLMSHGEYATAKRYILYREERSKERDKSSLKMNLNTVSDKYFSKEFLSKYKHMTPPFQPLGGFVYARTYARWLPELKRREVWYETVKRAVSFNLSLGKHTREEAEELFHNVFMLKQNLSGRMTWLGGTPTAMSNALGLFNCSFDIVDSFETFSEIFTLLMLGVGCGLRISKEDINKLPKVRTNVELISKTYKPIPPKERKEYTSLVEHSKSMVEIVVGDSRGAWHEALDTYFKIMWSVKFREIDTIVFNYNNIRGEGARIKNFGGKSSGYKYLMDMFEKIHIVLTRNKNEKTYKLKTIDALDIAGLIALNVVSGNVRRSSLMLLCDADDTEVINAKNDLYKQIDGEWKLDKRIEHRQMSNNTVIYNEKPNRKQWEEHFKKMRYSSEPAFVNMEQAIKRNPNAKGLNPSTF